MAVTPTITSVRYPSSYPSTYYNPVNYLEVRGTADAADGYRIMDAATGSDFNATPYPDSTNANWHVAQGQFVSASQDPNFASYSLYVTDPVTGARSATAQIRIGNNTSRPVYGPVLGATPADPTYLFGNASSFTAYTVAQGASGHAGGASVVIAPLNASSSTVVVPTRLGAVLSHRYEYDPRSGRGDALELTTADARIELADVVGSYGFQRLTLRFDDASLTVQLDRLADFLYYDQRYPDLAAADVNARQHYEQFGWREGRDPSIHFRTGAYLAANPDVAAAGVNPLQHLLQYGAAEGRSAQGDLY